MPTIDAGGEGGVKVSMGRFQKGATRCHFTHQGSKKVFLSGNSLGGEQPLREKSVWKLDQKEMLQPEGYMAGIALSA